MPSATLKAMLRTQRRGDLLVTPAVELWLVGHPEGIVLDDYLSDLLRKLTTAQPRNRDGLWAASAAATCERAQMFTYLDVPQTMRLDPRLQNIFNDGTWRHLRWQMMMMKMGLLDSVEVPVYSHDLHMRGTLDGIGNDDDGEWGFELKGVFSLSAVQSGPYESHLYQIHSYFLARPSITRFSLVYEDKRTQLTKEFIITRDLTLMKAVKDVFKRLNDFLDRKELPDVQNVCEKGTGKTFNDCSYKTICLGCGTWQEAVEISIQGS